MLFLFQFRSIFINRPKSEFEILFFSIPDYQ